MWELCSFFSNLSFWSSLSCVVLGMVLVGIGCRAIVTSRCSLFLRFYFKRVTGSICLHRFLDYQWRGFWGGGWIDIVFVIYALFCCSALISDDVLSQVLSFFLWIEGLWEMTGNDCKSVKSDVWFLFIYFMGMILILGCSVNCPELLAEEWVCCVRSMDVCFSERRFNFSFVLMWWKSRSIMFF